MRIMEVWIKLLEVFWFFLPAAIANLLPPLFGKIPYFKRPIDLGVKLRKAPLFGPSKTYKGFVVGILGAVLVVYLQVLFYPYMLDYTIIDYSTTNVWLLGFLFGFGALFGDLVASFFKRRIRIKSGSPWLFFDQLDWVFGGLAFVSIYIGLNVKLVLGTILVYGILHVLTRYVGYLIGITQAKI